MGSDFFICNTHSNFLEIRGEDCAEFLQGLITNDIYKVTDNNSCFASLLNPQGKYLFDFIIIKHKNGFFIDCEKKQIEDLFKQLTLYRLRSKVEILNSVSYTHLTLPTNREV